MIASLQPEEFLIRNKFFTISILSILIWRSHSLPIFKVSSHVFALWHHFPSGQNFSTLKLMCGKTIRMGLYYKFMCIFALIFACNACNDWKRQCIRANFNVFLAYVGLHSFQRSFLSSKGLISPLSKTFSTRFVSPKERNFGGLFIDPCGLSPSAWCLVDSAGFSSLTSVRRNDWSLVLSSSTKACRKRVHSTASFCSIGIVSCWLHPLTKMLLWGVKFGSKGLRELSFALISQFLSHHKSCQKNWRLFPTPILFPCWTPKFPIFADSHPKDLLTKIIATAKWALVIVKDKFAGGKSWRSSWGLSGRGIGCREKKLHVSRFQWETIFQLIAFPLKSSESREVAGQGQPFLIFLLMGVEREDHGLDKGVESVRSLAANGFFSEQKSRCHARGVSWAGDTVTMLGRALRWTCCERLIDLSASSSLSPSSSLQWGVSRKGERSTWAGSSKRKRGNLLFSRGNTPWNHAH